MTTKLQCSKLHNQVLEFMEACSQYVQFFPAVPPVDVVKLESRLVIEEAFELLEAFFRNNEEEFAALKAQSMELINRSTPRVDLPAVADALADLDYVSEHTRIACGINGEPIADEVHLANMAKLEGPKVDGKQLKPEGWVPPDVAQCLLEQGWGAPQAGEGITYKWGTYYKYFRSPSGSAASVLCYHLEGNHLRATLVPTDVASVWELTCPALGLYNVSLLGAGSYLLSIAAKTMRNAAALASNDAAACELCNRTTEER